MRSMRTYAAISLLLVGAGAAVEAGGHKEAAPDPLVVHEWGTFTSMVGPGGVGLEGLEHEEEALPGFVYSRSEVRECPLRKEGFKGLELPANHVTRKLETPVIYVRSKTARSLRVRVGFEQGLITQWYPVTDTLGPPELTEEQGALDLRKVERSFLEWDLDVLPLGAERPSQVPEAAADDPWTLAREVEASWLVTRPRQAPERLGPVEAERYLFYRGLGTFSLPFGAFAEADGARVFTNRGAHAVAQVVMLEVGPGGQTARYDIACGIQPSDKVVFDVSEGERSPISQVLPNLEADVRKILVGQGLAVDEALAMVRTWSRSWFRSEGTRFIYTVPRALTDQVLPLTITPQPDALVRVLIGRLEVITPALRAEVEQALRDAAGAEASRRARGEARLARLDRFLEPHLHDVLAATEDPALKALAEARLATLR
jgi:hypothetical protein